MTDQANYFEKSRSWAIETRAREGRVVRITLIIAGIATAIALFEAVALAMLTPLKTVQPITVLVDRQTGFVETIDPAQPKRIGVDAALTQSFLAQYVAAREGFDRATVSNDYRRVALWSSGLARTQYLGLMPASNPDSPLARYPGGTTIVARVKSVSPLSDGTALVRFDTQQQDRNGNTGPIRPWISVIRYRYSSAPMTFEDRLINPLGFQVASYRRDPEAPPPASSVTPTEMPMAAQPAPSQAAAIRIVAPAASISPIRAEPAMGRIVIRDVPLNQIPLGSPLVRNSGEQVAQAGQP